VAKTYRYRDIVLPKDGMAMIMEERQRQTADGYTAEYDQRWSKWQLRRAAEAYERASRERLRKVYEKPPWTKYRPDPDGPGRKWPWPLEKWKPRPDDRNHEWIIAGALYTRPKPSECIWPVSRLARSKRKCAGLRTRSRIG
jgi:hypothetical protein